MPPTRVAEHRDFYMRIYLLLNHIILNTHIGRSDPTFMSQLFHRINVQNLVKYIRLFANNIFF